MMSGPYCCENNKDSYILLKVVIENFIQMNMKPHKFSQ